MYKIRIPVEEYGSDFTRKLVPSNWAITFNCLRWMEAADNNPYEAGSEYGAFVAHESKLAYEEYLNSLDE